MTNSADWNDTFEAAEGRARFKSGFRPIFGKHEVSAADLAIHAEDVSIDYGARPAVADVSLQLGRGKILALVGPSGCGKTTFLKALNRLTDLVPRCVVRGRIGIGGQNVLNKDTDVVALRRRVGMIFQRPNPFPLSIARNFELPLRERGCSRDECRAAMERSLREVGLWDEVKDRLNRSAAGLSGGQQQRLCIARAIALEPEILLLDEPCSSLDPLSSARVEELMASLAGRYTLLVVTHNLGQARRLADDVALFWVRDGVGRLIEVGPAAQMFEAPRDPLTRAYVTGAAG